MRNAIALVLLIALIAGLLGCRRAIQRELGDTEEALAQARAVQAELYAPDTFHEAEDTLARARTAMEAERQKFLLSRSYDAARTLLASAKQAAYRAFYEAQSRMDMAREDAAEVIGRAQISLQRARASLLGAVAAEGREVDIDRLEEELGKIETTLADAERDLEEGHYREAREKGESVIFNSEAFEQTVASTLKKSTWESPLAGGRA